MGFEVTCSSVTGHVYTVARSHDLLAGDSGWTSLATGIAATPPINTYVDTNVVAGVPCFYRILLE
ncbi:MAG: hypothetical protein JXR37_37755 [Kiritimatiellae bacterium]|nr:hypothetical protein [Kiritimatiellia bacterium]